MAPKSFFLFVIGCALCTPLAAGENDFAIQGDVVITHQELDAAFARIPEKYRMAFIRDGEKVDQLVQSLLRYKQIARAAREADFDENVLISERMNLAAEKELAEAWLEFTVRNAPEADYEALAYEKYLANPELFQSEESVDVTHILIQSNTRPDSEALSEVMELHEKLLLAPKSFDEFVLEFSEDPAVGSNRGQYKGMTRGQMVKPFEDQAFALTEPGEISQPVKTTYGYHIIRLDAIHPPETIPFEQVRAAAVEQVRQDHLAAFQRNYILSVSSDPIQIPEGAIDAMVKRHFGENLELAPDLYEDR